MRACQNGAICAAGSCVFAEGCIATPCANGGVCDFKNGDCSCPGKYTGALCEQCMKLTELIFKSILIKFCSGACLNGGYCTGEVCACQNGYTGTLCNITIGCISSSVCTNVGICSQLLCRNGGTCNGTKHFCSCLPGYSGSYCEIAVNVNTSHCTSCLNGDCSINNNCVCKSGWYGDSCEKCNGTFHLNL
jgi:hypothetical protein